MPSTLFLNYQLPAVVMVSLKDLPPNKDLGPIMPDQDFVRNIDLNGVVNPICVKREGGKYTVIEERRRIKAARIVEHTEIPARIFLGDWEESDIMQLSLHIHRKANVVSELEAFENALKNGETEETIKDKAGLKSLQIRTLRQLQNLIPELRKALQEGTMKPSVASLAAKLPKNLQYQLLPCLKEEGKIKVKHIKAIRTARKNDFLDDMPSCLFDDEEGDWQVVVRSTKTALKEVLLANKTKKEWKSIVAGIVADLKSLLK